MVQKGQQNVAHMGFEGQGFKSKQECVRHTFCRDSDMLGIFSALAEVTVPRVLSTVLHHRLLAWIVVMCRLEILFSITVYFQPKETLLLS